MDPDALDFLIQKWLKHRGKRVYKQLADCSMMTIEERINYQFGYGYCERDEFDHFYDATRIKFFQDETQSTYLDALFELRPHMLDYFVDQIVPYLSPKPVYEEPYFFQVDDDFIEKWNARKAEEELNLTEAEQERQRRSKRLCVLQKSFSAPEAKRKREEFMDDIIDPNTCASTMRKPKKSNFNAVQWKHLQVQARKQLHEAVLSFDFKFVTIIANEWLKESEEERRLDIDAIEWAFRRICKQLLPHSAEKEAIARQNSIKMIETLFECFRSMRLCSKFCMRKHIIDICRDLGTRDDILHHMTNFRCSCCLTLQV